VVAYNKREHSALFGMTPEQVISDPVKEWHLRLRRFPWLARVGGTAKRAQVDPNAPALWSFVRVAMKRTGAHYFAKETSTTATAYSHSLFQVRPPNFCYILI
jgi:hypothetical protein